MPREYMINNKSVLLYTIGEVGKIINRHPKTIRRWERNGVLPRPLLVDDKATRLGKLRLYLKEEVDVLKYLFEKYDMRQGQAIEENFIEELKEKWNAIRKRFKKEFNLE